MWILILILYGAPATSGVAMLQVNTEFTSKESCEATGKQFDGFNGNFTKKHTDRGHVCIEKR